ncbi:MAG: DUF6034 family protein [Eubacteriales bacterium]|nr:DUF6034 family protein [Eubacteriales bacterium]
MDTLNILLEISIYSSAIFLVTLLLKKCFKNKMSPFLHYAVWMVLIARLMMPVTIASPVHLFVIPAESQNETAVEQFQLQTSGPAAIPETNASDVTDTQLQVPEASQQVQNTAVPKTTATVQTPVTISLPQIIIFVWLSGTGICLLYLIILYFILRRKICRNAAPPSKRLLALFEEVKAGMGIKANVKLVCQYEYGTPSLMFPKTIMMPIDALVTMNDEQAKFALRHELMHYKRGDQIISILLSLLNAVYWFNPFVWLAFRRIRTDMEIACDGAVVRRLNVFQRTRYASLIVGLFAQPVHRQLVLGMAQADARKVAEQRVRGIFMKEKSRKSVKFISALLAAALLITCFTTACQPTPETEIVVGRQEDVLENVETVASDDFEPIEVPDHVTETYDKYIYISMNMDADVVVPETAAYPVTEVTKKAFSDDDILSFIALCAGTNDELYLGWSLTKDEYLQWLTELMQYEDTGIVTQDYLDYLQEAYEKAPVEADNTPVSISDLLADGPSVYVQTGEYISKFGFTRNGNVLSYTRDMNMTVYTERMVAEDQFAENMGDTVERFEWLQPGEPEISQEDAYAIALEYIEALGIDLDLYNAEPCSVVTRYVHKTTGWQFTLTRTISNLKTHYKLYDGGTEWSTDTAPSYGSPWGQEVCTISVDKDGLCGLWWRGASEISSTVVASAQLEDFDTIQQRIVNQLQYNYGTRLYQDTEYGYEIEITEIRLGISLISVEYETDIGEYLPTWYVSYNRKFENQDDDEWEACRIMFNAIDGSYIDPRISNEDLMGRMEVGSSSVSTG